VYARRISAEKWSQRSSSGRSTAAGPELRLDDSIEFLLVTFPEERAVPADGERVGFPDVWDFERRYTGPSKFPEERGS